MMSSEPEPTKSFNLIDEPWIEVVDHAGIEQEISIKDLLENAAEYRDFSHSLGTVNFAILRVILAILYRAWDSAEWRDLDSALDHWQDKWEQDNLLDVQVKTYLESWYERFDIRHESTPFFQVPDLHTAKNEWKKLDILLPDVGDEGDLFSMRADISSIGPADAAKMLVHAMAYDYSGIKSGAVGDDRVKGGRGYPTGIGWAGWLGGTTLKGANLKETMLLNYCPNREEAGTADLPIWELPQLTAAQRSDAMYNLDNPERNGTTGPVELMTWPQRRLRLRWEGDDVVGVLITNGDRVGYTTKHRIEPMTPWRFSDPQTKKAKQVVYMPRGLDSGRAMWRSVGGLLPNPLAEKVKSKFGENLNAVLPADNVLWVSTLVSEDVLPRDKTVRLHMVSMEYGAQSSSFAGIVEDSLSLKTPLFDAADDRYRAVAREAVKQAEEVSLLLGTFYRNIVFAVSGETQVDTGEVREKLFTAIDTSFRSWVSELAQAAAPLEKLQEWSQLLKRQTQSIAREILSAQGPNVWTGRWNGQVRVTGANAELWLNRDLRKKLDPIAETTEKEGKDDEN